MRAGLLAYVRHLLPMHASTACWHPDDCFLCDARARAIALDDPEAVAAWLASHHYDPDAGAVDPGDVGLLPSDLEMVPVRPPDAPAFAIMRTPLTASQAARLLGVGALAGGPDAPWTGFDLNLLPQLWRCDLRLPTLAELEAAHRLGAIDVLKGVNELVRVDVNAQAIEIRDTARGEVVRLPISDLGKLDAIGQCIPNPVPASVGMRLACRMG